MSRKISLSSKFSLFLIGFTTVLLISLLGYLYYFSRQNIEKNAKKEVNFYTLLLNENFEKELQNSVYELNSLILKIAEFTVAGLKDQNQQEMLRSTMDGFFLEYSRKYAELVFFHPKWKQAIEVKPVTVFGGKIRAAILWKRENALSNCCRKLLRISGKDFQISPPEANSGNRFIYLSLPAKETNQPALVASIPLDYLFDKIIHRLNLPEEIVPVVTTKEKFIVYSSDQLLLQQLLDDKEPLLSKAFLKSGSMAETSFLASGTDIWYWTPIRKAGLFLFLHKRTVKELKQLTGLIRKVSLFAGILLIVVLLLVRILAGRMARVLQQIGSVADLVATGDFSRKIAIQRQDELGHLINAFNNMIERLNISYRALNQLNVELEQKVAELTRTRAELSQKQRLALIGETVSKISHEIQNKIGGVSIWVQNLEMQAGSDQTLKAYIQEMKLALQSFMEMLVNFKRFYREPALEKSRVRVYEMVENLLQRFSGEIDSRHIKINKRLPPDCADELFADREKLEEALLNLLLNALYFSPEGGKLEVASECRDGMLAVSFINQGPHIPPENAEKIFQPFFTTKSDGSGLGLAMVKTIIQAHRGKVSFENLENGRVGFTIEIPTEGTG